MSKRPPDQRRSNESNRSSSSSDQSSSNEPVSPPPTTTRPSNAPQIVMCTSPSSPTSITANKEKKTTLSSRPTSPTRTTRNVSPGSHNHPSVETVVKTPVSPPRKGSAKMSPAGKQVKETPGSSLFSKPSALKVLPDTKIPPLKEFPAHTRPTREQATQTTEPLEDSEQSSQQPLSITRDVGADFLASSPEPPEEKNPTIGVFTSGGDSCGMNAAVRAVVRFGLFRRSRVFFIHEGYQGMIDDTDGNFIREATWESVSGIIHEGGTVIGSARCPEFREKEGRLKAARNLVKYGITHLVAIGGDGTLTGANILKQEWDHHLTSLWEEDEIHDWQYHRYSVLHVVGIVGSIDNDFFGTDMTIGADSALHRILEATDAIATTATSHQRAFILEVMGRKCGYLALIAALTSEADYLLIPESPSGENWKNDMCDKLRKEREAGKRLNIIIVAEGATDISGQRITSQEVKDVIDQELHLDTRITVLGHVQRGGNPSAFDRILGCRMGAEAVETLLAANDQTPSFVITLEGNHIRRRDLTETVNNILSIGTSTKHKRYQTAMELRGQPFNRNWKAFLDLSKPNKSCDFKNFRCGIICVGAPACGINAAIRACVKNFIILGGEPYACYDGIDGFIKGEIQRLHWTDVDGWVSKAGAKIGTRRTTFFEHEVSQEETLRKFISQMERHQLRGLVIVGGFDAFRTCRQLFRYRKIYPELNKPFCVIPAAISNNVPGTQFSIGSDTAVNELTRVCDRLRRSAEGSKDRVFVIETMGGYSGYLPTMAGLAGGADQAYIFKNDAVYQSFVDMVRDDVQHMTLKMKAGILRGLVLKSEKGTPDITTINQLFNEEGQSAVGDDFEGFTSRLNIPGHVQEGETPSPFDRCLATNFGVEAASWMSKQFLSTDQSVSQPAVVFGLIANTITRTPITALNVDPRYRLPLDENAQWYLRLRHLLRILAMHPSVYAPS